MKRVDLNIGPDGAFAVGYLHEASAEMPHRHTRPCVVVCPGGGYSMVSDRENEPVASAWFAAGYQVFVLTYSVGDLAAEMRPLMELSELMLTLRQRHAEYGLDAGRIAVMGFSAGGHLAASLGTLWNHEALRARMDTQGGQNRPDAMILCYPVLLADAFAHQGSIDRVSGGDEALRALFSLEKQVTEGTPPAFLWHTAEDDGVPVENTLVFVHALRRLKLPFEAHVFERGRHGLSLCNVEVGSEQPQDALWFPLCLQWLNMHFAHRL